MRNEAQVVQTSLRELGLKPRVDKSGVADDKFTLVRIKPESLIVDAKYYLGFLGHDFAGYHLGSLLTETVPSPVRLQGPQELIFLINGDLVLPDRARTNRLLDPKRHDPEVERDKRHRESSLVGPSYINFDTSGSRLRWAEALVYDDPNSQLKDLTTFLYNLKMYEDVIPLQNAEGFFLTAVNMFSNYLTKDRAKELAGLLLNSLSPDEKGRLSRDFFLEAGVGVDFKNQQLQTRKNISTDPISLTGKETAEVKYGEVSAWIKSAKDKEGKPDWEAISYTFPFGYSQAAIRAVVAYANYDGFNRFINPVEVKALIKRSKLPEELLDPRYEAYLGRVLSAYSQSEINDRLKVPAEGSLTPGEATNRLMQASAGVLFSLEPSQRLLLADDAPLPRAFERAF